MRTIRTLRTKLTSQKGNCANASKETLLANLARPIATSTVLVLCIAFARVTQAASPSGQDLPVGDLPGWRQIFTDDFTTSVPVGSFPAAVSSKWTAYPDGWHDTSGNGTYYPSRVASIGSGMLNMYIHTENGVHMVCAPEPILPGNTLNQLYGRYVVRFRADALHAYKTAWLLWPQSEVWPRDGEIDFPEGDLDGTISAFMHHQGGTSGGDQDAYSTSITYTSWHTAITEWRPDSVTFILDGVQIGRSTDRIPNTPMRWVLQTETALGGSVPSNSTAGNVQIDWVAIYAYCPTCTGSANLASGKPVTVSSTESGSLPGSNAVDGNTGTRWSSLYSDPQWIYVDLQATYNLSRVKLNWETAYGRSYQIQVSANASSWTTIYSTTTGDGGIDDLTGLSGSGRYVRMYGTQRGTVWGYSLWEFEVYGAAAGGPVPDGTYKIIARHSGKCADAYGTVNGADVRQWSYGGGANQKWTLTHLGNSQYKIINFQSGRSLEVAGQSTADGANIQIWDYLGQSNQKWTITATSGGYYKVIAVHSGKAMDVSGASTANDADIVQWTYGGGNNQQWAFQAP